jgi:protocatechuate 3,4-dioxygenase, beta subunit
MNIALSRRRFLELSTAFGGLIATGGLARLSAEDKRILTAEQQQGPFYPIAKPLDRDADLTQLRNRRGIAQGQIIHLMGRVVNLQGKPLSGIKLEIWQANAHGRYAHINDTNQAPLDPNFQGYGVQVTDAQGRFRFKTIKPNAYPTGVEDWSRPPHIHYYLTGRHEALTTQRQRPVATKRRSDTVHTYRQSRTSGQKQRTECVARHVGHRSHARLTLNQKETL